MTLLSDKVDIDKRKKAAYIPHFIEKRAEVQRE
jgi:hypothetical protein